MIHFNLKEVLRKSFSTTMLYHEEYDKLVELFDVLPISLPENPPSSPLPPQLDFAFAADEGPWPAFNKAMHAAFGEKDKGLKIQERGNGLKQTASLIRWCLLELEKKNDIGSAELVLLWISELSKAAKAAGMAKADDGTSISAQCY
ncbi:MAG TPA: hypothetical protein VGO47_07870, partial [Chlamydiales bacterium]|nr:hypothetical protein [Chlamydiales bacterium]